MTYNLAAAAAATETDESTPCRNNELGVKGVGELGTIGATPAIVNAVVDALVRAGAGEAAERVQMPLTSERVWRALTGLPAGLAPGDSPLGRPGGLMPDG